jgi:cbb3-type cytochrome oxidase subunit 3
MEKNNFLYNYLIEKITIELAIKFFIVYFFIIWIAIIVWVYKDITNRTENIWYQIFSILTVLLLTPFLGLIIYLIIRPSKTLFQKYYEEVEYNLEALSKDIEERLKKCDLKKEKK